MVKLSDDSEIVRARDRVPLREEMLRAVAGDGFPQAQIRAAIKRLASSEAKIPPGVRPLPPHLVTAVQRVRLIEAMLEGASELGYAGLTVKDLVGRAGLSEHIFYTHFEGKEECFLTAFDAVAAPLRQRIATAVSEAGQWWRDRLYAALEELLSFAISELDAMRTVVIAARAVSSAVPRRDQLVEDFARCIDGWARNDLDDPPPPVTAMGIVGSIEMTLYTSLQAGETIALAAKLQRLMYVAVLAYEGRDAANGELDDAPA